MGSRFCRVGSIDPGKLSVLKYPQRVSRGRNYRQVQVFTFRPSESEADLSFRRRYQPHSTSLVSSSNHFYKPSNSVRVPPNCRFIIDDIERPWAYPESQKFDYVHQRSMSGSIKNWTNLYQQAKEYLRPGGYLEIQEFEVWFYSQTDDGLPEDSNIMKWQKLVQEASSLGGPPINYAASFKPHLQEAGFTDLQEQVFKVRLSYSAQSVILVYGRSPESKCPIGRWAKDRKLREIGMFLQAQMDVAVEAVSLGYFTRALGWTETETRVMIAQVKKEFSDPALRLYTHCYFVSGCKPRDPVAT